MLTSLLHQCLTLRRFPGRLLRFYSDFEYDYGDAACSFAFQLRPNFPGTEEPRILTPLNKDTVTFGVLQNCLVAVNKPVASLTFDLIDRARSAMGARHYCIGHAGALDVMGSGVVALLFGQATKKMTDYADGERSYTGSFRIGQTTKTFDALSPVLKTQPWAHVTSKPALLPTECSLCGEVCFNGIDARVTEEAQRMIGRTLKLTPPICLGKATQKDVLCHLRHLTPHNRQRRPMKVMEFETWRDDMCFPDFDFRVVCRTRLSVNCLIHELGWRLGCGAYVRQSERNRFGAFALADAWDAEELMEHIASMRRIAFLKDFDLYDRMRHAYFRSIGPRTNHTKKRLKRKWASERKIKQEIKNGIRKPRMTALCY